MARPTGGSRPVLVLLGPTAVGKTAIGIEVAERIGGEVISADSRAFFVGLDIVTDKPTEAQRRGVCHHLIDCVPLRGTYDAMAYRRDVDRLIPQIRARGREPMLVGGGTLYLAAVLHGLFEGPAKDDPLRASMAKRSVGELYDRLGSVDPAAAEAIHPNDRLRITRALEVHQLTGRPISSWQVDAAPLPYPTFVVGLRRERNDHRAAITARVRRMLVRGLIEEVKRLRAAGLDPDCQAYRTIGVPEVAAFLDGLISNQEMEREIARRTWGLARRQAAWFRRENGVSWWDVSERSAGEVAGEIVAAWRRSPKTNDA